MTNASERRDGPRIDLRLRVRYSVLGADIGGEAEASDISPKGLRIESDVQVAKDSELVLTVDAGDGETLKAQGRITWCKPRKSPTGKDMYDLGVAFESEWLDRDRGPLANALARIFAMNSYEPARHMERTPVSLSADSRDVLLEVADLSVGGMQLKAKDSAIDHALQTDQEVLVKVALSSGIVEFNARVAWTAKEEESEVFDAFGLQFQELEEKTKVLIDEIRLGKVEPKSLTLLLR